MRLEPFGDGSDLGCYCWNLVRSGYMLEWAKGRRSFQMLSGYAPRDLLERTGALEDFISLFFDSPSTSCPSMGV